MIGKTIVFIIYNYEALLSTREAWSPSLLILSLKMSCRFDFTLKSSGPLMCRHHKQSSTIQYKHMLVYLEKKFLRFEIFSSLIKIFVLLIFFFFFYWLIIHLVLWWCHRRSKFTCICVFFVWETGWPETVIFALMWRFLAVGGGSGDQSRWLVQSYF